MQVVHANSLPLEARSEGGREGTWERRRVMRGGGARDGFSLVIYYHDGSFFSPRHHHNFDQFRYQLDGVADFDRNGKMKPGTLGYFPEGAYYGPTSGPAHTVAVLQFGGPSGQGYLSSDQRRVAMDTLRKQGRFESGVFKRYADVEGKRNQDSFEAIWEAANGRKLVYPTPQYDSAVMVATEAVSWRPLAGAPGLREKHLGIFTDCEIKAARYGLEVASSFTAKGRGIYMVISGTGRLEEEHFEPLTTVYLGDGETVQFRAETQTDILFMGMPAERLMAAPDTPAETPARAAA